MRSYFSIKEEKFNMILKNNFLKTIYQFSFVRKLIFFFYSLDELIDEKGNLNKEKIKSFKTYRFLKFIKSLDYFNQLKSRKYVNIKIFNFFGLQIFRVLYFLAKSKIKNLIFDKKKKYHVLNNLLNFNIVDYNLIKNEGVIIKQNFLNNIEVSKIIKIFNENTNKHLILNNCNHITKKLIIDFKNKDLDFVYKIEEELRSFICLLLKINNKKIFPEIAIFQDSYRDYKQNISDHQDLFHTDVPYDTFKAFIYLEKVDKKNGVFSYIPTTNKISFKRLLSEYMGSINIENNQDDWSKNAAFKLFQNKKIKYCCEDAGTLVLANTCGYHARGPFLEKNKKRHILYFNYRYLNLI